MYQIDNSTAVAVIPASTAPGTSGFFTDGNPASGVPATILPAEYMNMVMMEIVGVLTAAGVTPSKSTFTQLATSIKALAQQGSSLYAADTGSANVYAVAYTPTVTALTDGMVLNFKAKTANTGASTFSPNGLTAKAVVGLGQVALQGGEIVANGMCNVIYSATLDKWVLYESSGGAQQVAAATKSLHSMQLGQATGRLINTQVFTASGTYTPTAGMTFAIVTAQGGGGAGAGTAIPSSGNASIGAPGNAGAYAVGKFLAAAIGASQVVTLGNGGTAASATAGGAGGTTSLGALIAAPGGGGGPLFNNASVPNANGNGTVSGAPTGGNLYAAVGAGAGLSFTLTASVCYGGQGGSSIFGPGGPNSTSGVNGNAGIGYGSGGSGAASIFGGAAQSGGAGKIGILIIDEYA